jgi:hypothetical protein
MWIRIHDPDAFDLGSGMRDGKNGMRHKHTGPATLKIHYISNLNDSHHEEGEIETVQLVQHSPHPGTSQLRHVHHHTGQREHLQHEA